MKSPTKEEQERIVEMRLRAALSAEAKGDHERAEKWLERAIGAEEGRDLFSARHLWNTV